MNVLTAPLRPIADVLDLTAEAVAALGTLSVGALTVALARTDEVEYPALTVVEPPRQR